jgi:hypothetical protein
MSTENRDQIAKNTERGAAAVGAIVGGTGAAATAAVVGTSSIPVVTTLASWVGVTAVAATPIGLVIGAGLVGAAAVGGIAYGLTKLAGSNGKIEGKQEADAEAWGDCK